MQNRSSILPIARQAGIIGESRRPVQAFGLIGLLGSADECHVYGFGLLKAVPSAYIWPVSGKDRV
jgi:hypothetical protein